MIHHDSPKKKNTFFFLSAVCLHFFVVFLADQTFFNFMKLSVFFYYMVLILCVRTLPNHKDFSPVFSSEKPHSVNILYVDLWPTSSSCICMVWGIDKDSFIHLFAYEFSSCSNITCWKDYPFHLSQNSVDYTSGVCSLLCHHLYQIPAAHLICKGPHCPYFRVLQGNSKMKDTLYILI